MPIKVLIIDDSALMRRLLGELIATDPALEVVGAASDPLIAREMIKLHSPDVLTLDVEMPRMDGLTFLRNLMRLRPTPVVMVSSLTERGSDATLAALELGAIDIVAKPKVDVAHALADMRDELIAKLKIAARTKPRPRDEAAAAVKGGPRAYRTTDRVIAIGASTGGTEAIAVVLRALPPDFPGIAIAQHIPPEFSKRFAERLDRTSALTVREARDGDPVAVGHVYIAPGQRHLRIERSGAKFYCAIGQDEPINRHRPSVDALFRSVAEHVAGSAIGVLLTGMGADGAEGLGAMLAAGAATIAQDQASSVVWGMPGEAVKRGAATDVLALDAIGPRLIELAAARVTRS